jgi:hypothetical protein
VVKPQVDVQSRRAGLRPWPLCWHRDMAWPACSANLLGTVASGVAARSMTALSAPSTALACRWRPPDLARAHGGEARPRVMCRFGRCVSMHVIELAERGARPALSFFLLGHLAEENEAHPLQGPGRDR